MDERQPWDRREDERERQYTAFLIFRDTPAADRSVIAAWGVYNQGKTLRPSGSFRAWAKDYDWDARASAWDDHLHAKRDKAVEAAIEQTGIDWVERQEDLRRKSWDLSMDALEKVARVLKNSPLNEAALTPWALQALAVTAGALDRMARLAAGMETDRRASEVSGPDGGPIQVSEQPRHDLLLQNPDQLQEEDLDAALATAASDLTFARLIGALPASEDELLSLGRPAERGEGPEG